MDNIPVINKDVFWYFEDTSNTPTYDPWLETYCLFCTKKLEQPIKSVSFFVPWDNRSYFYRCHKLCYESKTEQEIGDYEWAIIDQVFKNIPIKDGE